MILTRPERAKTYQDRGIFGTQTLHGVFSRLTEDAPDKLAFADADARGKVSGLSRAVTHARVEALAALMSTMGLKTDALAGIYMPNCADAFLATLAAWRAGLIVVPLPLAWSRKEVLEAVNALGIRAVFTTGTHEGEPLGQTMLDIAAETFSIRFLMGFGPDLPDGIMPVSEAISDPDLIGLSPEIHRPGNAADHVALVTFATGPDGARVPVPWSHNQLIVTGLAHMLEAGMESGTSIASVFEPAGLPAFAGGLVTALLADAPLYCCGGETLAGMRLALDACRAAHWLLPSVLAGDLAGSMAGLDALPKLSLVSRGLMAGSPSLGLPHVTDLFHADGLALVPVRRQTGEAARLHAGAHLVPTLSARGLAMAEWRLNARDKAQDHTAGIAKTVFVRGPVVPDAPWPGHAGSEALLGLARRDGFVACPWIAQEPPVGVDDMLPPAALPPAPKPGMLRFGRQEADLARISRVFSGLPGVRGAVPIVVTGDDGQEQLGVSAILEGDAQLDKTAWDTYFNGLDWPEMLRPKVVKTVRLLPRDPVQPQLTVQREPARDVPRAAVLPPASQPRAEPRTEEAPVRKPVLLNTSI